MSTIARSLHLVALPALLLALGCASTQSTTEGTDSLPAAIDKPTEDSGATTPSEGSPMVLSPVYFDTDRAELKREARETLASYAKELREHPEWGAVTVEGHCDERGSSEYNLALGQRRATSVQRYLEDSGVRASRLTTRSYGEESPAVRGHAESAWRYNRRSELRVEALESAGR